MKKKILISTGGSGGHVYPAITIYDHLKFDFETLICTDLRGHKYLNKEHYENIIINTPKINNLILLPITLMQIGVLIIKSIILLRNKEISILISTGGYMSLPLCLAAKLLKIKIFLIEPNMVLGRANKFFLKFSKKIMCYSKDLISFPSSYKQKLAVIKPLIRKKYYETDVYQKKDNLFTILVIGGSQGANVFDKIIHERIVKISNLVDLKIIHQTNERNVDSLQNFYKKNKIENKVFKFDKNLNLLLRQSDLCITRAGSSALAELTFFKIPFIAIPLPGSKDNHQFENAQYYKEKGCCWVIEQNNFDEQQFDELMIKISTKKDEYLTKKKNLENLNYQNTWNSANQNLLKIFNEN